MARSFFEYSPYRDTTFDEAAVRTLIEQVIVGGCMLVHEKGFLAGILSPLFFAPDIKIATELAWWAPDANGTEFRKYFEAWAEDNGAAAVQMTTLNNGFAARLAGNLTDNGYSPVEVSYLKAI